MSLSSSSSSTKVVKKNTFIKKLQNIRHSVTCNVITGRSNTVAYTRANKFNFSVEDGLPTNDNRWYNYLNTEIRDSFAAAHTEEDCRVRHASMQEDGAQVENAMVDRDDADKTEMDVDKTEMDREDADGDDVDRDDVDKTEMDRDDVDKAEMDRDDVDKTEMDRDDADNSNSLVLFYENDLLLTDNLSGLSSKYTPIQPVDLTPFDLEARTQVSEIDNAGLCCTKYEPVREWSMQHSAETTAATTTTNSNPPMYTSEQQNVYNTIMSFYSNSSELSTTTTTTTKQPCQFRQFLLVGAAGTGKSTSLKQFLPKPPDDSSLSPPPSQSFVYVTLQNNLVASMSKTFGLSSSHCMTLASFVMRLLGIAHLGDYIKLQNYLVNHIITDWDMFFDELDANIHLEHFLSYWSNVYGALELVDICTICIDEFSLTDSHILLFVTKLLEYCITLTGSSLDKKYLVLLFTGDFQQISPLFVSTDKVRDNNNDTTPDTLQYQNYMEYLTTMYNTIVVKPRHRSSAAALPIPLRYTNAHLTAHALKIRKMFSHQFYLSKQLRNNDATYVDLLHKKLWEETKNCADRSWINNVRRLYRKQLYNLNIPFTYRMPDLFFDHKSPSFTLLLLDLHRNRYTHQHSNLRSLTAMFKNGLRGLYNIINREINDFAYLTFTNEDAHYINHSTAYACRRQMPPANDPRLTRHFERLAASINANCAESSSVNISELYELYNALRPRLAPIYFVLDTIRLGNGLCPRYPFLPLVVGFRYRYLKFKICRNIRRYSELILLYIGTNYLIFLDSDDCLYRISPATFQMNLFCMHIENFEYTPKIDINMKPSPESEVDDDDESNNDFSIVEGTRAWRRLVRKRLQMRMLFGFPIQMSTASTIQSSIGMDNLCNLHLNLAGCTKQEAYVALTRIKDVAKIKGIYI